MQGRGLLRGELFLVGKIGVQAGALYIELLRDQCASIPQRGAVVIAGYFQQHIASLDLLTIMHMQLGDGAGAGRLDIQQAGAGYQGSCHGFPAGVVAEAQEQQDRHGKHRGRQGEHPARKRSGDDNGTLPLASPCVDDFLSKKPL